MKENILSLLRDQKDFLSGESISRQLGITRSAVWKAIQTLRSQGYQIESLKHHGYKLIPDADVFNEMEIRSLLRSDPQLKDLILTYFAETDSTNLAARRAADQDAPHGSLFVADCQTAGRGRLGRSWISQAGSGLWLSVLLRPQAQPASLANLTLMAGLCVVKALRSATGLDLAIKWPNDLVEMISGRKVCGILTETILEEQRVLAAVIGIGINVNTQELPPEIVHSATSLAIASGHTWPRLALLKEVLRHLNTGYERYIRTLDQPDPEWLREYEEHCATLHRPVVVTQMDGKVIEGVATGLTSQGDLIIKRNDQQEILCHAGEVSVRGLLGYL